MLEQLGLRLGDIVTVIAFLGGGFGFVYSTRAQLGTLGKQVDSMQVELKKLVDVLVMQARHSERMDASDERVLAQGKRLDELVNRLNRFLDGK